MVIVKLTRKEIIPNGIPVRKVGKKKRLIHLCPAQVSDISQSGHSEVAVCKKNFI